MRLEKKTAIVTGAAHGIGRAIAARFAAEGAGLVIADLDRDAAHETAKRLREAGGEACARVCDVTDEQSVAGTVDFVLDRYGRIDILVNNAVCGIGALSSNAWGPNMDVAVKGTWQCTRAVLPTMIAQHSGSIVNMSSVNALMGFGQDYIYTAAKGAIVSLTRCLATQYGRDNIRLNVVCPGSVETEQWAPAREADPGILDRVARLCPLGRFAEPHEVANAVLFLASDEASFVTGSVLVVDGGVTAGCLGFDDRTVGAPERRPRQ